ncbi:hypothetical protein ACJX0J_020009, partial [Zea mays]
SFFSSSIFLDERKTEIATFTRNNPALFLVGVLTFTISCNSTIFLDERKTEIATFTRNNPGKFEVSIFYYYTNKKHLRLMSTITYTHAESTGRKKKYSPQTVFDGKANEL